MLPFLLHPGIHDDQRTAGKRHRRFDLVVRFKTHLKLPFNAKADGRDRMLLTYRRFAVAVIHHPIVAGAIQVSGLHQSVSREQAQYPLREMEKATALESRKPAI